MTSTPTTAAVETPSMATAPIVSSGPTVTPRTSATAATSAAFPSPAPTTPAPTLDPSGPPAAALSVGGAPAGVPGRIGSYTLGAFASDGPWLPARILAVVSVPARATLVARFADDVHIAAASGRYAAAADERATVVRAIPGTFSKVDGAVEFGAPPVGDWVVELALDYPENQGSGSYYWRVSVTP
jgi:hypothetical protein